MSFAFQSAVKETRRAFAKEEIADELDIKEFQIHVDNVMKIFKDTLTSHMTEAFLAVVISAGTLSAATAKAQGDLRTAAVTMAFNVADTGAATWAEINAALLVTNVTNETRKAIAGVVADAFIAGVPPRKLAKQLEPLIGLTARDAAFVAAADVSAASKAALAGKLLKRRATVIARTESIRAANEGQRIFWQQAVRDGLLTGLELREWIITPDDRLCEICEPMGGQRVGLNDPFETGDGGLVMNPPAHPDCRCAVGLSDKTEAS